MNEFVTLAEIERSLRTSRSSERQLQVRLRLGLSVEQATVVATRWLIDRRAHLAEYGGHAARELETRFGLDAHSAAIALSDAAAGKGRQTG